MKFRIAAPDDFEQCRRHEYSHHRKLIMNITRRARKDSVVGSLNRSEEVVRRARFEYTS